MLLKLFSNIMKCSILILKLKDFMMLVNLFCVMLLIIIFNVVIIKVKLFFRYFN